MLISDGQQSDLGIHIYVFFHILFHYRLLQDIYCNSLCYSVCVCSVVSDSATPWTVAHQAPLSLEFSRQEYQGGLPFPPPRDLPNPGIKPTCPESAALAGGFFTTSAPWEALCYTVGPCCLFYIQQCVSVHPKLLLYPFPKSQLPLQFVFYVSLFLFCK